VNATDIIARKICLKAQLIKLTELEIVKLCEEMVESLKVSPITKGILKDFCNIGNIGNIGNK
jgi:hypothetical protein